MAKRKPWDEIVTVAADDMPWTSPINGETYHFQEGKTVTFQAAGGSGLTLLGAKFQNLQRRQESIENAPEHRQEALKAAMVEKAEEAMEGMIRELAGLIVDWTILGWQGQPLAVPTKEELAPLYVLPEDALAWLFNTALTGKAEVQETPAERSKTASPSRTRARRISPPAD